MELIAKVYLSKKQTSKILADASVTLRDPLMGDLVIKKIRIMQSNDGGEFVSLPQNKFQKDGKDQYSPIVWASKEWKEKIDEAVLSEYSREIAAAARPVAAGRR